MPVETGHKIKSETLLPWRKTDKEPVRFPTVCIFVPEVAESYDSGSPHFRIGLRDLFHDDETIVPLLRISN